MGRDGWMWYFPQYHILILILVLIAIGFMIVAVCLLFKLLARVNTLLAAAGLASCPNCHKATLVQRCTNPACQCIMVSRDPKPANALSPVPLHGVGD